MIREKTVCILGAGASVPYGYPTSRELRKDIISNFIENYKRMFSPEGIEENTKYNDYKSFVESFNHSSNASIDQWIAYNSESRKDIGAEIIAFQILDYEKKSFFREEVPAVYQKEDWYSYLLNRMISGPIDLDANIQENQISFISFNYDRSLEYFLHESLIHTFDGAIGPTEINKKLNQIPIIHIYGRLERFNWEGGNSNTEYREGSQSFKRHPHTSSLKTIFEDRQNNPEIEKAKELISDAEKIYFLGFGYAEENLSILDIPKILKNKQRIFGTALGMEDNEIKSVKNKLRSNQKGVQIDRTIENVDSLKLLRKYPLD